MTNSLRTFVRDESGATAIEYALIASLIAMVIISGVYRHRRQAEQLLLRSQQRDEVRLSSEY